jgi:nitroreductase
MDVHECIRTRRSMRKYTEEPVSAEQLARVLEACRWAPSWVNLQTWEVVVVDDPAMKAALGDCVPESNPGRKGVLAAPVVLAVCGRQGKSGFYSNQAATVHGDWVMFDVGIACQNICLAAWAEGLGSLHLGLLDHEKAGKVLGLPADVKLYELIPIGHPAKEGKAPPRREIWEFTHKNRFGTPFAS